MITENLSTLKIHKLTQAQYDRELENGTLDSNALYLTPDEASSDEASNLICYSETISGSLPTGTNYITHSITKTWSGGIPVVRSVASGDIAASPIIYTVIDDDNNSVLQIRTQRPTGMAANTAVSYALKIDIIRT